MDMDYYKVLEITELADEEQIKQAYRRLAKKYHPDLNQNHPEAEEKFKDIVRAYEVLGDAARRKVYDSKKRMPVIYGSPGHKEKNGYGRSGHSRAKYSGDKQDNKGSGAAKCSADKCGQPQSNAAGSGKDGHGKTDGADFIKDLERYFGFSFEEGKKVMKEQGSQETPEDSKELAEILKMFMKMK